uniref:LRRCT domain-containing protein n=1 Tax=Panagrellus redivivus TaxID=6233 RepID=A0A7E4VQC2_PANRE
MLGSPLALLGFIFITLITPIHTFPPAISFSPYKFQSTLEHFPICRYCLCDHHQAAVTCTGAHILINTLHLPPWTSTFHLHNVSVPRMPHFGYSPALKVLRINNCGLAEIHPLSFVPLPNLETVHLADNLLESVEDTLFSRLEKLRVLNLARNKIKDLRKVEFAISESVVLEQLNLDGNPIQIGPGPKNAWPMSRQVHLANTGLAKVNGTHFVFKPSDSCAPESCRHISIPSAAWSHIVTADLSHNPELHIDPATMPLLANLTSLNLAKTRLTWGLSTLFHPEANLRHLDIHGATLANDSRDIWHYCTSRLEWLDISNTGTKSIVLSKECTGLQWMFASDNEITEADIEATGLRVAHLDGNKLKEWPFVVGPPALQRMMHQLETLNLGKNELTSLPSEALVGFAALTTLNLAENDLVNIPKDAFPEVGFHLHYLNLSHNLIKDFPRLVLPKLQVLDLSSNDFGPEGISMNAFDGMPSLQHLHLRGNRGILDACEEEIELEGLCWVGSASKLTNLIELDVSDCAVTKISVLRELQDLQSLNLAKNELLQLDFTNLPQTLVHLNLRRNKLHSTKNLIQTTLKTTLIDLDIAENPLRCECNLFALAPLLSRQADYTDRSQYYCFAENWQHPLKSYLDSAEHFCSASEREDSSGTIATFIINSLALLVFCLVVAVIIAYFILKIYNHMHCKGWSSYTPVAQNDLPVDL